MRRGRGPPQRASSRKIFPGGTFQTTTMTDQIDSLAFNCPCCAAGGVIVHATPFKHAQCPHCLHRWHTEPRPRIDYASQAGRTPDDPVGVRRKHDERVRFLEIDPPVIGRALEIGCAEGLFGAELKRRWGAGLTYVGVELSLDAHQARQHLDKLHHGPLETLPRAEPFELILLFHVLEHLANPAGLIAHIMQHLASHGSVVIEVPNRSGSHLLPWDYNPEHRHFFTPTSLCALLHRQGLAVRMLVDGGYESAIYDDSIRIRATPLRDEVWKMQHYRHRLAAYLSEGCVIWGIGGDFGSLLQPYLDPAWIRALIDSHPAKIGQRYLGISVEPPETIRRHPGTRVLIGSHRFAHPIWTLLTTTWGVEEQRILTLEALLLDRVASNGPELADHPRPESRGQ